MQVFRRGCRRALPRLETGQGQPPCVAVPRPSPSPSRRWLVECSSVQQQLPFHDTYVGRWCEARRWKRTLHGSANNLPFSLYRGLRRACLSCAAGPPVQLTLVSFIHNTNLHVPQKGPLMIRPPVRPSLRLATRQPRLAYNAAFPTEAFAMVIDWLQTPPDQVVLPRRHRIPTARSLLDWCLAHHLVAFTHE